jgi:tousled-like kinase
MNSEKKEPTSTSSNFIKTDIVKTDVKNEITKKNFEVGVKVKSKNNFIKEKQIFPSKISPEPNTKRITDFFVNNSSNNCSGLEDKVKNENTEEIQKLKKKIEKLKNKNDHLNGRLEKLQIEKKNCEERSCNLEENNLVRESLHEKFKKKIRKILPDLVFDLERQILRNEFEKLIMKKHQFGFLKNSSSRSFDDWIDGIYISELKMKKEYIVQEIKDIEEKRNKLKYIRKGQIPTNSKKSVESDFHNDTTNCSDKTNLRNQKLTLKKQLDSKIRDIDEIHQKLKDCEKEKLFIVKTDRKFEEAFDCLFSKPFKNFDRWPIINDFKILSFLGRGGFAEVYKAFDLNRLRYVACKIHHINEKWSSELKQSYIKKTGRENLVFQQLDHPNIVKYYDSFVIDENNFCTILEYCEEGDLLYHIKMEKFYPEKKAKQIIKKLLDVVLYLNTKSPKVIHYDLKPGNILFNKSGELKVTDFGLCKTIDNDLTSIQLTSPGCGTFDYLPPECFSSQKNYGTISSKVDIYSIGVIFYQLLFGCKPFDSVNKRSSNFKHDIHFPENPQVSSGTKEFIKKCLIRNQVKRIDIFEAVELFRTIE